MFLDEYEKETINQFNGLFSRGSLDEVPKDHLSDLLNVQFNKKAQAMTRDGTAVSLSSTQNIERVFEATFQSGSILLTCDGAGKIYRQDTMAVLLNITGMIDFTAINMFSRCYILPIVNTFGTTNMYVWDGVNAPRFAAGAAPTSTFSAFTGGSGNVAVGVHQFAVSFITNTGYTTTPGPVISGAFTPVSLFFPGGTTAVLLFVPTGPAGTVARQIFMTQANLDVFYYAVTINDNTTTSVTINLFDTDLAISADPLFDLVPLIPAAAVNYGGASLYKYSNRLLVIGTDLDTVLVSNSGDAESFDSVTGQLVLQSEFDGNYVRAACVLFGTLYLTKSVGVYSTIDNGDDPNTWSNGIPTLIDGGVGAYQGSIGTITASQPSLSTNSVILMANREGLFLFNGTIVRPHLSWKIQDVWDTITHGYENTITLAIDTFGDKIYVLIPTNGATSPGTLLVADYSAGLDSVNIRWSIYSFPFTPQTIAMLNFQDSSSFDYFLRLGTNGTLYRLDPSADNDYGHAINSYIQFSPLTFTEGAQNIFRYIRFRATGSGTLNVSISGEDLTNTVALPPFTLSATLGLDLGEEINYTNEKAIVKVGTNSGTDNFLISRFDLYGKLKWLRRPNG